MIAKYSLVSAFLILLCFKATAQNGKSDSLFAVIKYERAMVLHEVKKGDNIYSIAQMYAVPAIVLSQNNDISFYESLEPGRKLLVPLGKYNYLKTNNVLNAKAIFYKLQANDSYSNISKSLDVPEDMLREWNNGRSLDQLKGKLAIGWVAYLGNESQSAGTSDPISTVSTTTIRTISTGQFPKKDSVKAPLSDLELVYNYQTSNESLLDSLNGMVVFFKPQTTVNAKLLYAFSNDIARGRVIKVVNPSNQKYIFAKIIGQLPATKQYINAKIGLDGRARAELETREVKLWCDFYFKY